MTPEQIFNIDLYLTENGEKGKLNRILAEVCEIFDSRCNTDELCTQLKLQCAEAVYKHNIAMISRSPMSVYIILAISFTSMQTLKGNNLKHASVGGCCKSKG